jgi:hypothetical protein
MTFGRLTVLERDTTMLSVRPIWKCRCQCGETTFANSSNLLAGSTRSCGCIRKETAAWNSRHRYKKNKCKEII